MPTLFTFSSFQFQVNVQLLCIGYKYSSVVFIHESSTEDLKPFPKLKLKLGTTDSTSQLVHRKMTDAVKLHGVGVSPFVCRVKIALNLKGVNYEYVGEDLSNKSADLIKYNPVYKKVPVLVHNGKPISESLVIVGYIDDTWKGQGVRILPEDAYEKAQARFWAKFIDDKCIPAISKAISSHGQEQAVVEAHEQLQFLENELKGTMFFGGDNINLVDISATYIAFWLRAAEEALGEKLVTKDKFPKLTKWSDNYINSQAVKDSLPPWDFLVGFYKKRLGKA